MVYRFLSAILALACGYGYAAETTRKPTLQPANLTAPAARLPTVTAVTSVAPGQAGYVHYFVITHPDESLEYQVGIELEDQRIAWSVPNAGVIVSDFIKKGTLNANGTVFKVEHLHGIRPFSNNAEMQVLQKELTRRVVQWIDDKTPYCLFRGPGDDFCLSCGDFVVRILFPGFSPLVPALPADFARGRDRAHSTDDLLLYLVGIYNLPDKRAKLARLSQLNLPGSMRDDIVTMIEDGEPETPTLIAAPAPASPSPTAANMRPAKPPASTIASRRTQGKRL